jgi:transposase-like protein
VPQVWPSVWNQLRHRRPKPGDKWHLDEVFLTINRERYYLWRAVDQDGHVLDILVQRRRDAHAAKKFFLKLLKGCRYVPQVIITDKLKSYGAAKQEMLPGVEHRHHRYLNNRVDNASARAKAGVARLATGPGPALEGTVGAIVRETMPSPALPRRARERSGTGSRRRRAIDG